MADNTLLCLVKGESSSESDQPGVWTQLKDLIKEEGLNAAEFVILAKDLTL